MSTIEDILDSLIEHSGASGATAALMCGSDQLHRWASGTISKAAPQRMPVDAVMPGGSTGKTICAATVLSLICDRKLDPDEPVAIHLRDAPWFLALPGSKQITAAQLLNHSAGLPDHMASPAFAQESFEGFMAHGPDWFLPWARGLELAATLPPVGQPGQHHVYSETGYQLLGFLVEAITGQDYYAEAQHRVLDRLGLSRTRPQLGRQASGLVGGYTRWGEGVPLPDYTLAEDGGLLFSPANEWCGGGFFTSAADLCRLIRGHATAAVVEADEKLRYSQLLRHSAAYVDSNGLAGDYGAGVYLLPCEQGATLSHSGFYPGYTSAMAWVEDLDIAVACQVNGSGTLDALVEGIAGGNERAGQTPVLGQARLDQDPAIRILAAWLEESRA